MGKYLVTGASRGIGEALVRELRSDNHEVLALARSTPALQALSDEVSCSYITADLMNLDKQSLKSKIESFGPLSGIVHNAGQLVNKPFFELSSKDVFGVYQVNALSAFPLLQTALPFVEKGGHIVAISSIGGINGSSKYPGLSAYSSSKAAIAVLMECLQAELGENDWSFNALALGAISTDMLRQAFPGYDAPLSPEQLSPFLAKFLYSGHQVIKGKILPISISNP
jgi:NAD(P)-dependent dehydrogenase (short-subunit alcohol dehydrogenase family)